MPTPAHDKAQDDHQGHGSCRIAAKVQQTFEQSLYDMQFYHLLAILQAENCCKLSLPTDCLLLMLILSSLQEDALLGIGRQRKTSI